MAIASSTSLYKATLWTSHISIACPAPIQFMLLIPQGVRTSRKYPRGDVSLTNKKGVASYHSVLMRRFLFQRRSIPKDTTNDQSTCITPLRSVVRNFTSTTSSQQNVRNSAPGVSQWHFSAAASKLYYKSATKNQYLCTYSVQNQVRNCRTWFTKRKTVISWTNNSIWRTSKPSN